MESLSPAIRTVNQFAIGLLSSLALFCMPAVAEDSDPIADAMKGYHSCLIEKANEAVSEDIDGQLAIDQAFSSCSALEPELDRAVDLLDTNEKKFSTSERSALKNLVKDKFRAELQKTVGGLKPFEFRELMSGRNFDLNSPGFKKCKKSPKEIECTELFDRVASIPAITIYKIRGRQLSEFILSTDRENFASLVLAFREKYGSPCETSLRTVQNRIGNSFESAELVWCFQSGKMRVSEIGSRITHSIAIYKDDANRDIISAPNIDF